METRVPTFQPKGGMCAGCQYKSDNCSGLNFEQMPIIATDRDTTIVRCTRYRRNIGGGSSN